MTTPIWELDDLTSAQADKFTTVNKNMRRIEALSSRVLSRTNGGPPGSPSDGDAYIVDVLSGSWAGFTLNDVVVWQAGAWIRYTPTGEGIAHLYVNDENIFITYSGSAWIEAGSSGGVDPGSATLALAGGLTDATDLAAPQNIAIDGDFAYVTSISSDKVTTLDISDKASISVVGTPLVDATNLNEVIDIKVAGKYAYVVCGTPENRLTVLDVSNPLSLSVVGTVKDNTQLAHAIRLEVQGRYAYIACRDSDSLTVVDISDPTAPAVVGFHDDATNLNGAQNVVLQDKYAYLVGSLSQSLVILDISDPTSPAALTGGNLGRLTTEALDGVGLYVQDKYAYCLSDANNKLIVVDVSTPNTPTKVGEVTSAFFNGGGQVVVQGRYAYVGSEVDNRLTIVDVSDPTTPVVVNNLQDNTNLDRIRDLEIVGGYAYCVLRDANRVQLVDLKQAYYYNATIDTLQAASAFVRRDLVVGENLEVRNVINVGPGGIFSQGDIVTSGKLEAATVNTGQGDNKLYAMDQDVQTTDNVQFANTITANLTTTGTNTFSLTDNTAAVFEALEGANSYFKIDTTDSSEKVTFGNVTTNPDWELLGTGTATFGGDVVVTGDFTVNGTVTTVNSTNMEVTDALITLADGNTGTTLDIGIIGERDTGNNAAWFFDESADEWVAAFTTSTSSDTTVAIGSYAPVHVGNVKAGTNSVFLDAASKRIGIGTEAPSFDLHMVADNGRIICITGTTVFCERSDNTTDGSRWSLAKTRGTQASPAQVQDGDVLGRFRFVGYIDAAAGGVNGAEIRVLVDGTPGDSATDIPTKMVFAVKEDGSVVSNPPDTMSLTSGGLDLILADAAYKHDGVELSSIVWVSATAAASTLDAAGSVTLKSSTGTQQYKIRELRLVGGGTNFGAGGDRNITVSDGTTTWTTIPNATIESLPADTARWGDAEIPFNAGTSDTASAAGTDITIQYAGGTTDHSGTGSLTIVACLEKVA